MHHPELSTISFICAILLSFPLPWHFRASNVAMLSIIFWLFSINITYAVDAIIWNGNVNTVAVVWCDISTKMIIGCNIALPAACLCVCIHLEQLASVRQAIATEQAKRRRQFFEAGMCFGLPVLVMALHYTVQGHRFDIIEDYGCRPTTYVSWPSILLIWVLPILLAVFTLGFACAAFAHFMRRRIDFARHLEHRSALTTSRYMRLIVMSIVEMFWGLAITSYNLYTATLIYRPWIDWAGVHFNFSRIDLYSAVFMPQSQATELLIIWASVPISSLIFVLFFAFGHDAMTEYRERISWFKRCVLRRDVKVAKLNGFGLGSTPRPPPQSAFSAMSMSTIAVPETKSKSSPSGSSFPSPAIVPPVFSYTQRISYHGDMSDDRSLADLPYTPLTDTMTPSSTQTLRRDSIPQSVTLSPSSSRPSSSQASHYRDYEKNAHNAV